MPIDEPDNLVLETLRNIRATQAEHTAVLAQHSAVLARLDRRVLAIEFNITRIRRENAGDAETAMATILEHDQRLSRLEQLAAEPS